MPDDNQCPRCQTRLDGPDAIAQGRCRVCGWDLALPDAAAKEEKPSRDPRRYAGKGRKR